MPEPTVTAHLSIGEVLALLLEEFPDVTISKIRFLESQGLIEPERTPSGYRKFYASDVDLLRVILREQRENFLPLRVIKDRIDSGQLEPPPAVVAKHPAAGRRSPGTTNHPVHRRPAAPRADDPREATDEADLAPTPAAMARPVTGPAEPTTSSPRLLPGVLVTRDELCAMASITPAQLAELEAYGVVAKRSGPGDLYGEDAVEVASAAGGLLRAGLDARHLRAWRTSVEREAGLFEQIVTPLLRQRNPNARAEACRHVDELSGLGARLRGALMRAAIHQYLNT